MANLIAVADIVMGCDIVAPILDDNRQAAIAALSVRHLFKIYRHMSPGFKKECVEWRQERRTWRLKWRIGAACRRCVAVRREWSRGTIRGKNQKAGYGVQEFAG